MNRINVKIKKLDPQATLPRYGTEFAAGADLYALLTAPVTLLPGQTVMISTGLAMELPVGYVGLVYARSGLACKSGLAPANKVGVIDSDYRGEIKVALYNQSGEARTVCSGDRIAQLVIAPYYMADFEEVSVLEQTPRGTGGFGSTGT